MIWLTVCDLVSSRLFPLQAQVVLPRPLLETGRIPWQKGWDGKIGAQLVGLPINGKTNRPYTRLNKMFLSMVMAEKESADPRFFTMAMLWQQKATQEQDEALSGRHWLHASNLYSIAAYPHLKGDDLAEQAQTLATRFAAEHPNIDLALRELRSLLLGMGL